MEGKDSSRNCPNCGVPLLPRAKFCTQCGTKIEAARILCPSCSKELELDTWSCPYCGAQIPKEVTPPPDHKIPEPGQKPTIETDTAPVTTTPSQVSTFGTQLLSSLRENISTVIVVLGALSIIAAISFTIIVLLPRELISDVEIPPFEGIIFDLFVILGLIALITKELTVYLGYIPKKETLDRWFSFVLILIFWTNLITFSLGLVEVSVFFQFGLNFTTMFVFLSLVNFLVSLLYFMRYREPLFSSTFITTIMSIIYLLQWIIPIDITSYTILIFLTTFGVIFVSQQTKDMILFIGLTILLPLMFLSPYLLSNSIVIAIIILLVSFPYLNAILQKFVIKEPEKKDLIIKSLGDLCSTFGTLNVGFSVFYGHLPPILSIVILAFPVIGFIILKVIRPNFQRLPLRDGSTSVFLLFTLVFFDFIIKDLLVLFGVAFLLILYSTFTIFEYASIQQQNLQHYAEFFLLLSLLVVSLTNLLFLWKICLLLIPLLTLLILITQKKAINHHVARGFVFGSEILILVAFLQTPAFDWPVIPIFTIIIIIGVSIIFIFYKENRKNEFSLDLAVFSLISEGTLLVMMLWTKSSIEMLYPAIILLALTSIITISQIRQKISPNFLWLNSTFIVCFGLMTYWNEFDIRWTVSVTFLLILPILIEGLLAKSTENLSAAETIVKNRNLNISLTAIGLALIILFEELDPISHAVLFLIIPIVWIAIYLFDKLNFNSVSELLIIVFPGIIFTLEMLLKQEIFTPITDNMYLYLTLITFSIPVIVLQVEHFLLRRTKITINPLIIGTALASLIIMVAFWTYKFQPEENLMLVFGLIFALIISVFLIKWQYESILLLLVSFLPSTLYAGYIDFPSTFAFHLIPIFPILFNLIMGLIYIRTDLSAKLHEFLMLIYFGIFILFNPIQMIEYTTALFTLFYTSWLFLGLIKRKISQVVFISTNLLNSIFVLVLMVFIDPLVSELFIQELGIDLPFKTTLISLTLVMMALVTLFHIISWQLTENTIEYSFLMAFTLIFNSSAFILSSVQFLIRTTEITLNTIVLCILSGFTILLILFLISYARIKRLKTDISLACTYTAAIWVLLSSIYFPNIELVFLWLFFAPLMILVFISTRKRKEIVLLGIIFYFFVGLRLIEHILEFLLAGTTEWSTIFGLIIFGIELVSLGIYSSISAKKINKTNNEDGFST
ncbi:MAG: zinc ribbon domain-containing protein [Promethearchaeota archaeon]